MRGFEAIRKIYVPASLIKNTYETLRDAGARGCEAFVLWIGRGDSQEFSVTQALTPSQTAYKSPLGVCVRVGEDELHRISVYLHGSGLKLVAQIHSHPTEAYHSDTDDAYAIATTIGSLSIVIPDFGVGNFESDDIAVYRLDSRGTWIELDQSEWRALIEVLR